MATSLKPFCSKRLTISPTRPRCTPSGLIMMKVRSFWSAASAFSWNLVEAAWARDSLGSTGTAASKACMARLAREGVQVMEGMGVMEAIWEGLNL